MAEQGRPGWAWSGGEGVIPIGGEELIEYHVTGPELWMTEPQGWRPGDEQVQSSEMVRSVSGMASQSTTAQIQYSRGIPPSGSGMALQTTTVVAHPGIQTPVSGVQLTASGLRVAQPGIGAHVRELGGCTQVSESMMVFRPNVPVVNLEAGNRRVGVVGSPGGRGHARSRGPPGPPAPVA